MKYHLKRIFAVLLAVLVAVSTVGNLAPAAFAEEIEVTDAYVLTYNASVEDYEYGSFPYMYTSPFLMAHSYNDPETGSSWSYTYSNEIFQLVNTAKLAEGGTGAYASLAVYCTDVDTNTTSGSSYRRINLEDSTYHATGAAARLRAVILSSFPYIQEVSAIEASANIWLNANGETAIEGLQIGEAMVATQQAIWSITHGSKYTIVNHYSGFGGYDGAKAVYQINSEEIETEYSGDNIEALYNYLVNLKGMAPLDDAVSESTFENVVYSAAKNEDGTYTITATFTVNTTVGTGDALNLSASCDGQVQSVELLSGGQYAFTFENVSDRKEVKLEINGYQVGGDVYLFDATGDRDTSQSMIGYDNSRLPVHGEVVATPDRVLNIYKTTSDAGKMPLANIEFEVYQVATMKQLESGVVTLGEKPTASEIETYKKNPLIAVLKTDVQGFATYNFTENDMPDGVYMIVERYSTATTGPVEPFYIIVPGTTESGDGYAYTITVNPKNTTEQGPNIQKDVTRLDNNHDTYDVNETHTWIIRGGVPAGIDSAVKYEISDTIDYRLTYHKGSPVVKLATKAGEELSLSAGIHYTLTEGTAVVNERTVECFRISLTSAGMAYVADNLDSGSVIPEIRVYFKAVINANASMGEEIPNQAHLDYTNSAGVEYEADSDEPEVHTGGTNILKTDTAGNALEGAVFKIARETLEGETATDILTVDGESLEVVFADFYAATDLSGEKVTEVTTDKDGKAVIYGLSYGTYYIVETKAPQGYNLLTAPIKVEINAISHLTEADGELDAEENVIDKTVKVINTRFILPETGGMGTTVFTVTGFGIICAAAMLIVMNTRRKKM